MFLWFVCYADGDKHSGLLKCFVWKLFLFIEVFRLKGMLAKNKQLQTNNCCYIPVFTDHQS